MRTPTLPDVAPDIDRRILSDFAKPYKVLLHNDDHHEMFFVVKSLRKAVPSLSRVEAFRIMLTAHRKGKAVVIVCVRETAEYYQERIMSFGLTSTIEPAE